MAKSEFMDWLDRETARRGIDEKEIAALVDQMMVEDQHRIASQAPHFIEGCQRRKGPALSRPLLCFELVERRFRGDRHQSVALS
jgi:hypothetical protein